MKKILMVAMMVAIAGCSSSKTTVVDESGQVIGVSNRVIPPMKFTATVVTQPSDGMVLKASVPKMEPILKETPQQEAVAPVTKESVGEVVMGGAYESPDNLKLVDDKGKALERVLNAPLPKWAVLIVGVAGILALPLIVLSWIVSIIIRNKVRNIRAYEN